MGIMSTILDHQNKHFVFDSSERQIEGEGSMAPEESSGEIMKEKKVICSERSSCKQGQ
jgi:hypothetical protein